MKRAFLIIGILIAGTIALIVLLQQPRPVRLVDLRVSEGLKNRRLHSAALFDSITLPDAAYRIEEGANSIIMLPYEGKELQILSVPHAGGSTLTKTAGFSFPANEVGVLGDTLWIWNNEAGRLYFILQGALLDSIRLPKNIWCLSVLHHSVIYNAEDEEEHFKFYRLDRNSGAASDSLSAAMLYGIEDNADVNLRTSGHFRSDAVQSTAYYYTHKSSDIIMFEDESTLRWARYHTIDITGVPKIIDKEIMKGVVQRVPDPEMLINTSMAVSGKQIFVLSHMGATRRQDIDYIDVYNKAGFSYLYTISCHGLPSHITHISLSADEKTLYVLGDDKVKIYLLQL